MNRQAIESRFAARESTLLGERGHIVEEGNRQREALAGRHAADQAALANESRRAVTDMANVKAEHARTVKEARNALAAVQRQHSEVLAKAGSYSLITYVNFVVFTVIGKSSNRA